MKNDKLFEVIGYIDDDLISEAGTQTESVKKIDFASIRRYALPFAALFVVCIGIYSLHGLSFGGSSSSSEEFDSVAAAVEEDGSTDDFANDMPAETFDAEESSGLVSSFSAAAEDDIKNIPTLLVNGVEAYVGSWTDSVLTAEHEWEASSVDSASVLDYEGLLPVINSDGVMALEAEIPMTYTAYCYPAVSDGTEHPEAVPASVEDGRLTLPDIETAWIVVVVGSWNEEDNIGQCDYYFETQPG